MLKKADYIIIGAGPAGVCAANILSKSGKKVLIIGKVLGGAYCSAGNVVSKSLINLSRMFENFRTVNNFLIDSDYDFENFSIDFKRIKKNVESNTNKAKKLFLEIIENCGAEYIDGSVHFTSNDTLEVELSGGEKVEYKFKKCLIATGSTIPKSQLYTNKKYTDVSSFVSMDSIPESVTVVGGGVLGVEVASFFYRLGSKVTIVEKNEKILYRIDSYISKKYEDMLKKRGISIITNYNVSKIERVGQKFIVLSESGSLESEEVFICTGRIPAVQDLDLSKAGINVDDNGYITYSYDLRTSNRNIFVAGDASHLLMNSSWAYYSAVVASKNMLDDETYYSPDILPLYIDTDPEIAAVGLSEEMAKENGIDYGVIKYICGDVYGFFVSGGQQTYIKLIYNKTDKTFLGIQALGRDASSLIALFAMMIKLKITADKIPEFVHINPVFNEFFNEVIEKVL